MIEKWRPFIKEVRYYINRLIEHPTTKGLLASGGTVITMLIGNINTSMQSFLVLLAADYATGLIKASKKGELSSWMSRKGWGKISTYTIVIILGNLVTQIGMKGMREFILLWAGATEAISVLENCDDLGIYIPTFLKNKLLKEKRKKFGEELK